MTDPATHPQPAAWPPPAAWPAGTTPAQAPSQPPGTIQAAAIVTWVCCVLTALLTVFLVLAAAFVGSIVLPDFGREVGVQLALAVVGSAVLSLASCALASWFAWRVWRRAEWARIALAASSGIALVLSVLTLGPHTVLVGPGAVAVLVLLFLPQSNDWLRAG